jgi:hypothetical protein
MGIFTHSFYAPIKKAIIKVTFHTLSSFAPCCHNLFREYFERKIEKIREARCKGPS